jgi:chitinase
MGMLGGAAKGTFTRLDLDDATFEAYYTPLRDLVRQRGLDGLDLDVEERMSLTGVVRLIDRLRSDFGSAFTITLAPVAAALMSDNPRHNLSGFGYKALEAMRGSQIAWYNTQFYCGWGDMSKPDGYDLMMARGWPAQKIVVGLVTNPGNGSGWIPFEVLDGVLTTLKSRYPGFGGVMGWEYFNSLPGDRERPWEWAVFMTKKLRSRLPAPITQAVTADGATKKESSPFSFADVDANLKGEAPLPIEFGYYSDGSSSIGE